MTRPGLTDKPEGYHTKPAFFDVGFISGLGYCNSILFGRLAESIHT